MKETLYNCIWGLGVRLRNIAKRAGLLGAFELTLVRWGLSLIHPPTRDIEVSLPWGGSMVVLSGCAGARNLAAGLYETDVTNLFRAIVKEGMVVTDLGACIGYHTLLASRLVGPSGRVYAFEPNPRAYSYLLRNIEANGCGNVLAVQKAASDKTGAASLVRDPESYDRDWVSASSGNADRIGVETITLDAFFTQEGWPSVGLVKMDIEGSEKAALEGMRELSQRNPHMQVIMEFNLDTLRRAGATPNALFAVLLELGFHNGHIIEQGMKPFPVAQAVEALPKTGAIYNLLLLKE